MKPETIKKTVYSGFQHILTIYIHVYIYSHTHVYIYIRIYLLDVPLASFVSFPTSLVIVFYDHVHKTNELTINQSNKQTSKHCQAVSLSD